MNAASSSSFGGRTDKQRVAAHGPSARYQCRSLVASWSSVHLQRLPKMNN